MSIHLHFSPAIRTCAAHALAGALLLLVGLCLTPEAQAQDTRAHELGQDRVPDQSQGQGAVWINTGEQQRVILPRLTLQQRSVVPGHGHTSLQASTHDTGAGAGPDAVSNAVVERLLSVSSPTARRAKGAPRMTTAMLEMLQRASQHFAVDAHLVKAVIHAESAFNPRAVSPKNAIGLMQVLPSTARDLGLQDLQGLSVEQLMVDPRVNIVLGTKYLAEQLARFNGNVELAVAAYNAGPGAVLKAGLRVPNYPETQQYVRRVLSLAQVYRRAGLQGEPA